jgi:hypothetical protein
VVVVVEIIMIQESIPVEVRRIRWWRRRFILGQVEQVEQEILHLLVLLKEIMVEQDQVQDLVAGKVVEVAEELLVDQFSRTSAGGKVEQVQQIQLQVTSNLCRWRWRWRNITWSRRSWRTWWWRSRRWRELVVQQEQLTLVVEVEVIRFLPLQELVAQESLL